MRARVLRCRGSVVASRPFAQLRRLRRGAMVCGVAAVAGDRVPEKIDIGPLYNVDPARRAAYR